MKTERMDEYKVLETKDEVIERLKEIARKSDDEIWGEIAIELFLLYHEDMGKSVSQAYEDVLRGAIS